PYRPAIPVDALVWDPGETNPRPTACRDARRGGGERGARRPDRAVLLANHRAVAVAPRRPGRDGRAGLRDRAARAHVAASGAVDLARSALARTAPTASRSLPQLGVDGG